MKLLANYKDWIKPEWVEEALALEGYKVPHDFFKDNKLTLEEQAGLREAMDPSEREIYDVYGTEGVFFHLLESSLFSFEVDHPPWIATGETFCWEVIKMYTGEFIPVHRDILKHQDPKSKRFWVPMLDWKEGHIFMYEDLYVHNYKAGDVFLYDDPRALHSAINIGTDVRLIMQVTTYKE
jgi:hypothetical protein